jgi:VanZ family protein
MVCRKRIFIILYLLFIVYGSLFPFTGWRPSQHDIWSVWMKEWSGKVSHSDLLTNILVYIPFGFLLALNVASKLGFVSRVLLSAVLGTMLSVSMEYLQMFLPGRTSSLNDVLLNALSSCCGALCAWLQGQQSQFGKRVRSLRQQWFTAGRITDIGLIILGAWALMQLAPCIPSLDIGDIKNGLKPIWYTVRDPSLFDVYKTATYSLYISALAAALILVLRHSRSVFLWHFFFVGSVLLCKIPVTGRQLSLEALAGLCIGSIASFVLRQLPEKRLPLVATGLVMAGFAVDKLRPVISAPADFHEFSWIPCNSQIDDNLKGVGSIVEGLWPFAAMAYFVIAAGVVTRKIMAVFWGGGLACIVFFLEDAQKQIPGRYPDITIVLLAVVGWSLPWLFPASELEESTGGTVRRVEEWT